MTLSFPSDKPYHDQIEQRQQYFKTIYNGGHYVWQKIEKSSNTGGE